MTKFGLTPWDEKNERENSKGNKDFKKFSFMKLKEGGNPVRVITQAAKFRVVNYKNPGQKGFGTKLKIAYPGTEEAPISISEDPALNAGFTSKIRYYVGVLDREDLKVKILDISAGTYNKIKSKCEFWGDPSNWNMVITRTSKESPDKFYDIIPIDKSPLTESEQALVDESIDELNESLVRLSRPMTVEALQKKMEALGYKGGVISNEADKFKKKDAKTEATSEKTEASSEAEDVSNEDSSESSDIDVTQYDFTVSSEASA